VYRRVFRELRGWCTLEYLERGGTGVPYNIYRGEGLVYRTVFRDGRYCCTVQYLESEGTCVPYSI
jgi:hypothetical protein